jgi:hypothetical protein
VAVRASTVTSPARSVAVVIVAPRGSRILRRFARSADGATMPPRTSIDCEPAYTPEKKRRPAPMALGAAANACKAGREFCSQPPAFRSRARREAERMSQTTMNIAAINGPRTIPFIPKISRPPSVDSSTT